MSSSCRNRDLIDSEVFDRDQMVEKRDDDDACLSRLAGIAFSGVPAIGVPCLNGRIGTKY